MNQNHKDAHRSSQNPAQGAGERTGLEIPIDKIRFNDFMHRSNIDEGLDSNGTVMFFSYLAHIFARRTTVFLLGLVER